MEGPRPPINSEPPKNSILPLGRPPSSLTTNSNWRAPPVIIPVNQPETHSALTDTRSNWRVSLCARMPPSILTFPLPINGNQGLSLRPQTYPHIPAISHSRHQSTANNQLWNKLIPQGAIFETANSTPPPLEEHKNCRQLLTYVTLLRGPILRSQPTGAR